MSTLRRLGEELYKPRVVKFNEDNTEANRAASQPMPSTSPPRINEKKEAREGAFFKSANLHVRMLSSLIILKTLTQGMNHIVDTDYYGTFVSSCAQNLITVEAKIVCLNYIALHGSEYS